MIPRSGNVKLAIQLGVIWRLRVTKVPFGSDDFRLNSPSWFVFMFWSVRYLCQPSVLFVLVGTIGSVCAVSLCLRVYFLQGPGLAPGLVAI